MMKKSVERNMDEELEEILYPEIEPYDKGHVQVSNVHKIYYEQYGNKNGQPVFFLHGGPAQLQKVNMHDFLTRKNITLFYITSVELVKVSR
jgi:hypothetical protein